MSQYVNILTTGGQARVNFLNQCVLNGATDYVFEFLVLDYNSHPTKKKAIAMYDAFCAPDAPHKLNCDELLGPTGRLHGLIAFYRESAAMNVFQKIALKGLRSADKNIFDKLLPSIFRQEDLNMMNGLIKQGSDVKPAQWQLSMLTTWHKTKAKLIAAGCDCIRCTK
jgi:hypothetical protein